MSGRRWIRSGCAERWPLKDRHGTRIDVVAETGSTNADVIARASAGEDIDGVVLLAEYQSAGRGRHGWQWSAPPRSQLSMSVGIGVGEVPAHAWGWLPLGTGVAVVDALTAAAGVDTGLKWPNDVLVDVRKLAGILAEVAGRAIVVGIGLNATMTSEEAPDPRATSLLMLDVPDDRNTLAAAVLRQLRWPHRRLAPSQRRRRDAGRRLPFALRDSRQQCACDAAWRSHRGR
jgi:BirA family transcriptional regulator, biotin operon repressor / biotin---[acetyl-CoA-carboxylase] ligase